MLCERCGITHDEGSYCPICGSRLIPSPPAPAFCIWCGGPLKDGVRFCGGCGKEVAALEAVGAQTRVNTLATRTPNVQITVTDPPTTQFAVGATPELVDHVEGGKFGARNADIAVRLGSNWTLWLPLAGVLVTTLVAWWTVSLGTEFTFTRTPLDHETPSSGLHMAIIIFVALSVVYLIVRDSRIGFPQVVVGDAWVAFLAVVALLPLLAHGFMGFTENSTGDSFNPTEVVIVTCLFASLTVYDAVLLLTKARKDVPFIKRGSWTWESSPQTTGQGGAARRASASEPASRKPVVGRSCADCGKTVTPEAWVMHQSHCVGRVSQNV
jgi:hypothetical protein